MSMKPGAEAAGGAVAKPAMVSVKDLKIELAAAQEKIKSLEAENALLKAENEKLKAGA